MNVNDPETTPREQWRPGVETRMLVSARNGASQLCIFEQWVAPGNGAPTHSHAVEEALTVLQGEAEMWLDHERMVVKAGQSMIVPAGRLHGFRNSGTVPLHIHAVLASPVFEATPEGATEPVRRWEAASTGRAGKPAEDKTMPGRDKSEIIRALFAAYLSNDRKAIEDAFTDDFRFTSPYDDRIDKPTYFARCWRVSDWIERQELERIFVEGDGAFVTYRCVAKGGRSFRNTEFFTFEGERIKRIDVYFGAAYQDGAFVRQQEN
jgi:mannose-6-phosphate isomerase-like protein (cupin superfamily)/ketosteroid isomerase-like protein